MVNNTEKKALTLCVCVWKRRENDCNRRCSVLAVTEKTGLTPTLTFFSFLFLIPRHCSSFPFKPNPAAFGVSNWQFVRSIFTNRVIL
uniref:Uncharacterized protein n=1 Tax=Anguilla anguilla TaxID=7936 RepID=A0A0E9SKB4_ANGAN